MAPFRINRRDLLTGVTAAAGLPACASKATAKSPTAVNVSALRLPCLVQSGDVTQNSAILWMRSPEIPGKMTVEWATNDKFTDAKKLDGPVVSRETDFTGSVDATGLPPGAQLYFRANVLDASGKAVAEAGVGKFRTAPANNADVFFAWSGDVAGGGWGINPDWGGLKIFESMRKMNPDFFIHSGDMIYADGPLQAEVPVPGGVWRNLVTAAKSKVAESLDDFRGNYAYNFMDTNYRKFFAEVPLLAQWDDHEVVNNWYPGRPLNQKYYRFKSSNDISSHARRAYFEWAPIRDGKFGAGKIFRVISRGPLLDVFILDERSYRGPSSDNKQPSMSPESAMIGSDQLAWVKQALLQSKALWKVIASDMPFSLIEPDGKHGKVEYQDGWGQSNGPPLGREHEIAEILTFCRDKNIKNLIVLAADVHYPSAHYFDPNQSALKDSPAFWEFVAGPLHAQPLGPHRSDTTFGANVRFQRPPPRGPHAPSEGFLSFGTVRIDGRTGNLTARLHGLEGDVLWYTDIHPALLRTGIH